MKVINSWDLPEEPTMNSRCADCNYEDCRCDRPPMPAASPWRTDVENAPRDGSEFLGSFSHVLDTEIQHSTKWIDTECGGYWWAAGRSYNPDALRAFATINQPEIPNDNP